MSLDRGTLLLSLGALTGAALAGMGLASGGARAGAGAGAAAVVNGRVISSADFDRAFAALAADRRDGAADPALRAHVLDRLIDEELLVQRGLELGLAVQDPQLRAGLSRAVIELLAARADETAASASDGELEEFHASRAEVFRVPVRVEVDLSREDGGRVPELPPGPLPLSKVRDYAGGEVAEIASRLAPGETGRAGELSVRVAARVGGELRPFAEVRDQVRAELRRAQADLQLRRFFAEARARAEIERHAEP